MLLVLAQLGSPLSASADHPGEPSERLVDRVLGKRAELQPDGLYEVPVRGEDLTTHGPDVRPEGADPRPEGFENDDPGRDPVCASEHYQHVLYAREANAADRMAESEGTIRDAVRRMNAVLNQDAIASGDRTADYRVLCEGSGQIRVDGFTTEGTSFTSIVNAARAAGFDEPDADYTIFFDGYGGACGVGSYIEDDRAGESNRNNSGGGYGITYRGCWLGDTPMHENGHNQGAVQYGAPYSTGTGGHCWDERDVLCYSPDGGDLHQEGTIIRCEDRSHFDCGDDTYFDTAPEPGEWLATHWNLGSPANRFIDLGELAEEPAPNAPPTADFDFACEGLRCAFSDRSSDPEDAIASRSWRLGDGAEAEGADPVHVYAQAGTYWVELTVADAEGATDSIAVPVSVAPPLEPAPQPQPQPDPGPAIGPPPAEPGEGSPPAEPIRLRNRRAVWQRSPRAGEWRRYRLAVPRGRRALKITLRGRSASGLRLFVRRGRAPSRRAFDCARRSAQRRKVCRLSRPRPVVWHVGVLGTGSDEGGFRLKAVHRKRRR